MDPAWVRVGDRTGPADQFLVGLVDRNLVVRDREVQSGGLAVFRNQTG